MTYTTVYHISGMTCEHCVRAVQEELGALAGVQAVDVELVTGGTSAVTVTSSMALSEQQVSAAVDEAGYVLVSSPVER